MLALRDISKSYRAVQANRGVSLTVEPGKIVGLVGENGAGKSTLLSIVAGFLQPDSGEIAIDGRPIAFSTPAASIAAGIGMVHQHLSLVPTFTIREQLELSGWSGRALPQSLAKDFTGREIVEQLSLGHRQRVEIAKALVPGLRVLLLDEPTSILVPSEVEGLFSQLRELRDGGTSIVIVTHKLREVMSIADRVVVMTGGSVTGEFGRAAGEWPAGTARDILDAMFAWTGEPRPPDREGSSGEDVRVPDQAATPLLRAMEISTDERPGARQIRGATLELAPGRMHAIVGIDGQGQTELAEVLAGYRAGSGRVLLETRDVLACSAIERADLGMALLVDDRLAEGAVASFSIAENLVLKRSRPDWVSRFGLLRASAMASHAARVIEDWSITPRDPGARFATLSGGNMQRVLAARELGDRPKVLISLNPVQGLDSRTATFMWGRLRELCEAGSAVLFFTTDLDEAMTYGDRVGVMFDGRLSTMEATANTDARSLGSMMVNGW